MVNSHDVLDAVIANVYGYFNQKGGVGKTTMAINSVVQLAIKYPHKRFLFIDTDPQCNSSSFFLEDPEAFYEGQPKSHEKTLYNTLVDMKELPILGTRYPNIDFVPCHAALSAKEPEIGSGLDHKHARLAKQLNKVKHLYAQVIIDGIHSLGIIGLNALFAMDHVILCVSPGEYPLQGLKDFTNTVVFMEEELRKTFTSIKILKTQIDTRNKIAWKSLDDDLSVLGDRLFKTFIPLRTEVSNSQRNKKAVIESDPSNHFVIQVDNFISESFNN
jgi:chromosome partitioning protein